MADQIKPAPKTLIETLQERWDEAKILADEISGDDCITPGTVERFVELIQGLKHWLKIVGDPEDWVCPECGGDNVEVLDWLHVNTNKVTGGDPVGEYWCPDCETHPKRLEQRKYFRLEATDGEG